MKKLSLICKKILDKSPLKFPLARQMCCLDPTNMFGVPDACRKYMRQLVQTVVENKHLRSVAEGDKVVQQFDNFLDLQARDVTFENFNSTVSRVDNFLHGSMKDYPELWSMVRKLLLLSHGQASVERGFSVNKEVETWNMKSDTIIAHRLICDYVSVCGGVLKVPITKEVLNYAASARSNYRLHLEEEKKRKLTEHQSQKRKLVEDEPQAFRKKRKIVADISEKLCEEADKLAVDAEGKKKQKWSSSLANLML